MPTNSIALQILLILLPGFAASSILRSLTTRAKQTDFGQVIDACLFSLLIYATYVAVTAGEMPFTVQRISQSSTDFVIAWARWRLALLAVLTIVIALLAAVYINKDGNRMLRRVKVTERTTRHSIWNDVFESVASQRQIVQVELEGERSVLGVLSYYSDDAEDCSIYIRQASWVGKDGVPEPVHGDGVLLTKSAGIKSVSLLDPPK